MITRLSYIIDVGKLGWSWTIKPYGNNNGQTTQFHHEVTLELSVKNNDTSVIRRKVHKKSVRTKKITFLSLFRLHRLRVTPSSPHHPVLLPSIDPTSTWSSIQNTRYFHLSNETVSYKRSFIWWPLILNFVSLYNLLSTSSITTTSFTIVQTPPLTIIILKTNRNQDIFNIYKNIFSMHKDTRSMYKWIKEDLYETSRS